MHGHFYFITIFFKLLSLHLFTLFKKRYGEITQEAARYPLFVIKSKGWDAAAKPSVLVTGGTHGYETSGVQGALLFAEKEMVTTFSSSHPSVLHIQMSSYFTYSVGQELQELGLYD